MMLFIFLKSYHTDVVSKISTQDFEIFVTRCLNGVEKKAPTESRLRFKKSMPSTSNVHSKIATRSSPLHGENMLHVVGSRSHFFFYTCLFTYLKYLYFVMTHT
jgi:hypothetical protein